MTKKTGFLAIFYQQLRWVLSHLPFDFALHWMMLAYRFFSYLCVTKRRNVRLNLNKISHANNSIVDSVKSQEVSTVFAFFGRYMVEFWGPRSWRERMFKALSFTSKEYLDQARNTGKPVILLSSHTGNWELGAWFLARMGLSMAGLYWTHPDRRIQEMYEQQRNTENLEVISWRDRQVVSECNRALREGKILAIVADIDYAGTGLSVHCSGLPIRVSRAPAVLAKRAGAIILPTLCIWTKGNHEIIFEESFLSDSYTSIESLVQKIAAIYVKWAIQYPLQRLVFHRFGD